MLACAPHPFKAEVAGSAVDARAPMGFLRCMSLQGPAWLPTRVVIQSDRAYFLLKDVARGELRDPFLQQTLMRVSGQEQALEIPRGEAAPAPGEGAPAGIIFHVGRCGSTLVSQTLKQIDGLSVYAEPLAVNELLLAASTWTRAEGVGLLRNAAHLFARHASGPYVWKLSSWNTLFASFFAEAFPQTPWVFCVRDPIEVAVSMLRDAPPWFGGADARTQMIARMYGATATDTAEARISRLFDALCRAITDIRSDRGRLIDYADLPGAIEDRVAPHFGFEPTTVQRALMHDLSKTHAKAPLGQTRPFHADAAAKRGEATATLKAEVGPAASALARLRELMS